jgi:hypothetical protein
MAVPVTLERTDGCHAASAPRGLTSEAMRLGEALKTRVTRSVRRPTGAAMSSQIKPRLIATRRSTETEVDIAPSCCSWAGLSGPERRVSGIC